MVKTWRPVTAGILNIIFSIATLIACVLVIYGMLIHTEADYLSVISLLAPGLSILIYIVSYFIINVAGNTSYELIYMTIAIIFAVLGILAVIGGIFCIRRKLFWLSLAGSIGTLICNFVPGLLATVFTAAARSEFSD